MIKGGYKIVNFNGAALSGTAVELPGIYDQIVDDYDKPIMVSGVTISGELQDDAYAGVQEKTAQDLSKSVELTVYGGVITVTEDDEVTFASAKSNTELEADVEEINTGLLSIENRFKTSIGTVEDLGSYLFTLQPNEAALIRLVSTVTNALVGIAGSSSAILVRTDNTSGRMFMYAIQNSNGKVANMAATKSGDTVTWSEVYLYEGTAYTPTP